MIANIIAFVLGIIIIELGFLTVVRGIILDHSDDIAKVRSAGRSIFIGTCVMITGVALVI